MLKRHARGVWVLKPLSFRFKLVTDTINESSRVVFKKRRFTCDGEEFEIDAAYPATGEPIHIGIDVKRIESRRDIHKRADEIINKATKFKKVYPGSKFIALVYYPFAAQHLNAQSRLRSPDIDEVFFAGETKSSVEAAVEMLVGKLGLGLCWFSLKWREGALR
jgi:hypothetical protein